MEDQKVETPTTAETENTNAAAPAKKNKFIPIIGICIILLVIFFVGRRIVHGMHYEETENAQIETNIIPISNRITGYVSKIYVNDNQFVKAGDTILVLEQNDLILRLNQAKLSYQTALAQMGVLSSNTESASVNATAISSNIATAQANVDAARVRVWKANQDYDRYSKLLQLQSITQQQYDAVSAEKQSAEKQLNVANMQLNAAKEQATASRTQASTVGTQLKPAEITAQQRLEDVKLAQLNLSYSVLIAPVDGYISKKSVQVGQLLNPGQTIVYVVEDKKVWVLANFKETQIKDMKVGLAADLKVDAYEDLALTGKIESIQYATGNKFSLLPADNASGNFVKVVQRIPVKILIDESSADVNKLRAGMNCKVSIKIK